MKITCFTIRLESEANEIREKISQQRTAIEQSINTVKEWEVQLSRIEKRIQDLNALLEEISQKKEYTMTNLVDDILKEKGGES